MFNSAVARFYLPVLLATAPVLFPQAVSAGEQAYRYEVSSIRGTDYYHGPVTPGVRGSYFIVETDASNRITRVRAMRGDSMISETQYSYDDNSLYFSESSRYVDEHLIGTSKIQRDASGFATRADYYDNKGQLTAYALITYSGNEATTIDYDPAGIQKNRIISEYSGDGRKTETRVYFNDHGDYADEAFDTYTGDATKSSTYFGGGALDHYTSYTRDDVNDLIRADGYNSHGQLSHHTEFSNGLATRTVYPLLNVETRFSYDAQRRLIATNQYYDGRFVCSLTYDKSSDGSTKRTLVKGPSGEIWAEYPHDSVTRVYQDGKSNDGTPGAIYKDGPWW